MDLYDLQARQAPIVLAVTPLALVAIALIPGLGQAKLATASIGGVVIAGLLVVGQRYARSAGHARQARLFQSWGGLPTTAMLRFRDSRLNPETKRIYRERLARLGANFPIPSEADEESDPTGADIKIGAAMDEIRRRAKERNVKAVHRELINYGAARNIYGLKPFGLVVCAISIAVLLASIALRGGFSPGAGDLIVGAAILLLTGLWLFGFTERSVRHPAEAYARALFEAIEPLTKKGGRA